MDSYKKVPILITYKRQAVSALKMSANPHKTREDALVKRGNNAHKRITL